MVAYRTLLLALLIFFCTTPAPTAYALGVLRADRVSDILARMSLEEKIGQLFIIAPDDPLEEQIRTFHAGGFVLFDRHASSLQQAMELIEQIRQLSSPIPPLIAVDQEGGRVARLNFTTSIPSARTLSSHDAQTVKKAGRLLGEELAALGFNVNFAPVMDVNTDPANPVIGDRAYGAVPSLVSSLGSAYIEGLHEANIAATAKHFPGHGDTCEDSHYQLPIVNQTRERLDNVELAPFRAAIAAGVDLMMTAHVHYPTLDPEPGQPATLSRAILTELLRNHLGFNGVIITDAMNMKAITNTLPPGAAAVKAFLAGVDIILMPEDLQSAHGALLAAVRSGQIPMARLDGSVRRVLNLKFKLMDNLNREEPFQARLQYAKATVGSSEHAVKMTELIKRP